MKSQSEIKNTLKSLKGIAIQESFYRFVGIEYINDLLSSVGSWDRGGRYNLKKAFEVLYIAPDPQTAIEESIKPSNFKLPPKIIVTIDVNVQEIIDLEEEQIIEALGIDTNQLFSAWRIPMDKESYTQTLGCLIYESKKFEGIRYPSATIKDKYNLALFPDKLKKGTKIEIYDPDKLVEQIITGKN